MTSALVDGYSGLVCDLDGVVYRGGHAVPGAADALARARHQDLGVVFATNNASRPPEQVAETLTGLGVPADAAQVLTSSMVGARLLASRLPAGAAVLAIGGEGVPAALRSVGLTPIEPSASAGGPRRVDAVLQGYGAGVCASDLAEAAYAVQRGAQWIATNDDRTLPTDRGLAPGNGTLVAAVRETVEQDPEVVGKPGPLMYEQAAADLGAGTSRILAVGDRLETDIAGAHAAGMDALHVLTGVHGPADLVAAPERLRPRFVATDLRALFEPYERPAPLGDGRWAAGGVVADLPRDDADSVRYESPGHEAPADIERIRLALAVLWDAIDDGRISETRAVAALPPDAVA